MISSDVIISPEREKYQVSVLHSFLMNVCFLFFLVCFLDSSLILM
jgi:hypothetical protein